MNAIATAKKDEDGIARNLADNGTSMNLHERDEKP